MVSNSRNVQSGLLIIVIAQVAVMRFDGEAANRPVSDVSFSPASKTQRSDGHLSITSIIVQQANQSDKYGIIDCNIPPSLSNLNVRRPFKMRNLFRIISVSAMTAWAVAQSPAQWSPAGPGDGT